MNYKVKKSIKSNKKALVVVGVLWIILSIVLVAPIAYSIGIATVNGVFDLTIFIQEFFIEIASFSSIGRVFTEGYAGIYVKTLLYFTIIYAIFAIIGLFRSRPKHEYTDIVFFFIGFVRSAPKNEFTDIEHGSSDWSQRGEQYTILSKNKGLILAEDNYLPLDKRGNTNVLVVGRIWFW